MHTNQTDQRPPSKEPLVRLIGGVQLNNGASYYLRPKASLTLAILCVNAGHSVAFDDLVDELWNDTPPASYRTTVQTYIVHIRRSQLAVVTLLKDRLSYRIEVDPDDVDLLLYIKYQQLAQRYLGEGRLVEAERLLDMNARMQTGPIFGGLPRGPILSLWADRYHEFQLASSENRFEVLLRQGRHREIVPELSTACRQRPFDETLTAKLMLALYRCGKRLQVLGVYGRFIRAARDELGLETSHRMQRLHQRILADDQELLELNFMA